MPRILVVDDEPHVTRMTRQKLEAEGYEVMTAADGEEALVVMSGSGPFDAIVTDYNMPKMDGRELCEAVRDRYGDEEIHIFLVTARIEAPLHKWAEGPAQVDFIEKPVSLRDLVGRLEKCFAAPPGVDGRRDD